MTDFNPLLAFCEMHHDKLIDGKNTFGPAGAGKECDAFLWSRQYLPVYRYPYRDGDVAELRREPGEPIGGYYLYVLDSRIESQEKK